jgi:thymidylate synthase (FAD)
VTDLEFRSDPSVDLVDSMGSDSAVVAAARVSVVGVDAASYEKADAKESAGLISYLMSHRHGSAFEHGSMTFRVEAPLYVAREWFRHRIGWSYNEASGRYSVLPPVFHVPNQSRPLVNAGTSARPRMVPGSSDQYARQATRMRKAYHAAYFEYEEALTDGVAKEVAREILPVGIYSTWYATANPRSIMSFLSLRVHDEHATFVSYPQYEIEQAAQKVEDLFASAFPITHAAFIDHGRVAP